MNLGYFHVGDGIPLALSSENASGTPTLPTTAPVARIYSGSTLIETVSLPICERYKTTAYFQKRHVLGSSYSAGRYHIIYQWVISGTTYKRTACFDVASGGDADGNVIAAAAVARPEAQYVLYETESGKLQSGRNPS